MDAEPQWEARSQRGMIRNGAAVRLAFHVRSTAHRKQLVVQAKKKPHRVGALNGQRKSPLREEVQRALFWKEAREEVRRFRY